MFKKYLFRPQNSAVFPEKGSGWLAMKLRLWQIKRKLQKRDVAHNLGWLYTLPHQTAVNAYKYFLDQNPNHLGNWTTTGSRPFATQELEREVIWNMVDLYHADKDNIEGYITSGGTESNIFSTWVGRTYLEQYADRLKICLLATSLTHYSIRKSADITGVPSYLTPLDPKEWNLDQRGLVQTVTRLYKQGYRGFLLPLTLGYTMTGTCDNIEETTTTVQCLQKGMKDVHFFLWIDAALNGLTIPFLNQNFTPFASKFIQTLVVDFHKMSQIPYPAGIILYRRHLRKLIEKTIDYLPETDTTVLGSRSGIPSVVIWTMMHYLGKQGYNKFITSLLKHKNYFITQLQIIFPNVQIVTDKESLSCGVIFHGLKNYRLPAWIEKKYGLYTRPTELTFNRAGHKNYSIYKFFFLPHLKQHIIQEFLREIAHLK